MQSRGGRGRGGRRSAAAGSGPSSQVVGRQRLACSLTPERPRARAAAALRPISCNKARDSERLMEAARSSVWNVRSSDKLDRTTNLHALWRRILRLRSALLA
jgi:hypothetical protein